MFSKLLKHEFRSTGRSLSLFSIGVLLAGVFGFFISLLACTNKAIRNSDLFNIITVPIIGLVVVSLVAYIFASITILYKQFYKSKFTDEGYLTFTLPVSTHQILLSSILNTVIWMVICSVVLLISVFLLIAPYLIIMQNYTGYFSFTYDSESSFSFWEFLYGLSSMLYYLILPFLSITLGALWAKKKKLGAAFGIGYGINMIINYVSVLLLSLISLAPNPIVETILHIAQIGLLLLLAIGGYFLMHYFIKKKLNL